MNHQTSILWRIRFDETYGRDWESFYGGDDMNRYDQWCNKCYLVGAWTNAFETYVSYVCQIGSSLQVEGWTQKKLWNHHLVIISNCFSSFSTRWFRSHLTAELMARTNRQNLQLQGGTPWRCLSPCILGVQQGGTTNGKKLHSFGAKPLPSLVFPWNPRWHDVKLSWNLSCDNSGKMQVCM